MLGKRIAGTAVASIVATLTLGAAAFAGTALTLGDTATLAAEGAGVRVPVKVSCDGFEQEEVGKGTRSIFVQVTQRVGDAIASGSGNLDQFACDGTEEELEVLVAADPSSRPFRKGVAIARANLSVCAGQEPFECRNASDQDEVEIKKK